MIFHFSGGVITFVYIPVLLLFLFCSVSVLAEEIFNPIQNESYLENAVGLSEPEWSAELKERFFKVRVKIFPHNSKYNAPQGRDTVINKLTVSSSGECTVYKSEHPTSENEMTRKFIVKTGKKFELTTETVIDPLWIECSQAIEVKRPDFPNAPISYAGTLFVKTVKAAAPYLTAVNVVPFEQYLKGVVPSEMPASWSAEALKAQAIAARTYAYYELGTEVSALDQNIISEQSGAQIDDTVTYQAYLGLKNNTAATDKAIDQTTGQVMTYNNKVIKAYFSADSGGHTEDSANVWGDVRPYIIGKPEIYPDGSVPGTAWNYTATLPDLSQKLIAVGFLKPGEELAALNIDRTDLYPSSRPKYVEMRLTSGTVKKIWAVDYAFAVKIKSPWINFTSVTEAKSVVTNGRGFGHGAGMSQWGARAMVDKMKKTHVEVLTFYYTNIQIQQ